MAIDFVTVACVISSVALFQVATLGCAWTWSKPLPFPVLYSSPSSASSDDFCSDCFACAFSYCWMTRSLFANSLIYHITDGLGLSTWIPSEVFFVSFQFSKFSFSISALLPTTMNESRHLDNATVARGSCSKSPKSSVLTRSRITTKLSRPWKHQWSDVSARPLTWQPDFCASRSIRSW